MCPATPPQVVESWARTPTLPDDESTSELEPANAEHAFSPRAQAAPPPVMGLIHNRGPAAAASQPRDHRDDNDRTSEPRTPSPFHSGRQRKGVWHAHSRCQTTRAPASSNRRMPNSIQPMPSHCLQPQSRCGTASSRGVSPQRSSSSHSLSIVVIVTTAIAQVAESNG